MEYMMGIFVGEIQNKAVRSDTRSEGGGEEESKENGIQHKYKMPFKYTMFRRKILAAKYFWKSIHSRAKPSMFLFSILRRKRSAKL